jgi:undecaprenyl phosphate-alpha-L-ara4N flippase subunit ArnE
MKLTDLILVVFTTMLLTANQVLLKLWMGKYAEQITPLSNFRVSVFFKPELIFCGLAFVVAGGIWVTMLKRLDFSLLYPMISMSYIFGLIAAKVVFHEQVSIVRWLGVVVIIVGLVLISRT